MWLHVTDIKLGTVWVGRACLVAVLLSAWRGLGLNTLVPAYKLLSHEGPGSQPQGRPGWAGGGGDPRQSSLQKTSLSQVNDDLGTFFLWEVKSENHLDIGAFVKFGRLDIPANNFILFTEGPCRFAWRFDIKLWELLNSLIFHYNS